MNWLFKEEPSSYSFEQFTKDGDLAEDEGKKALEKVQVEVDVGVKKVDDIIANKEKDLMQV